MKTKREILIFQDIKRVCDTLKNGYLATTQEEKISCLEEIDNILEKGHLSQGAFIDISNLYDFKTCGLYGVIEKLEKMGYKIIYKKRKKIKDLTLSELKAICDKHDSRCMNCLISKFVAVCLDRNIPLIIENPYSADHYLVRYWPFLPKIIDLNRREMGDYFEKPTQYYFFNLEPCENLLFDEPIAYHPKRRVLNLPQREKSEISPDYARRFIRRYING